MTRSVAAGSSVADFSNALPRPHIDLFSKPTPLEHLPRFGHALGAIAAQAGHDPTVDVWIKREDLMSVGFGGNKLRNLEFYVGAARTHGADVLVTSGRGRANHCRLTAAAAARAGLRCVLVLSGPQPAVPSPNERISDLLGAELRYAPDSAPASRDALLRDVLAELRGDGATPHEIELGASGLVGASGQVLAGIELAGQAGALTVVPDLLFVGMATGGTYAGLRVGLWRSGLATTVVGVPTYFSSAPSEAHLCRHVARLMAELREIWGVDRVVGPQSWSDEIVIDDLTPWLPYGVASPHADPAARLLGATEGIAAEPVYTARMVASVVAWARAGRLGGRSVVLWHGGGTPALFEDYGGVT